MLKREQNDLLTQTGPGTAAGRLFRSYWIPALLADELPENDCPPVRVKLLSERLIAFRDTNGRYGLMDEFCAHRGVSLWFARNEDCGLRCPYHGWKYDHTGQCVEVPSEPEASGFAGKIKLKSYPLVERGGVLWTYMGDPADAAAAARVGVHHRAADADLHVQADAGIQLAAGHGGRHRLEPRLVPAPRRPELRSAVQGSEGQPYNLNDSRPVFEVVESPGGLYIGARRNAEEGKYYWRITQWVMPSFTMIAPRGNHSVHGHFWIPIDDENCWAWSFDYHPIRELTEAELSAMRDGKGIHVRVEPGSYRPLANKDNDYLMDRAAQKAGRTFSGIEGIGMQDASLQESMGPIVDRTKENLVSTDNGIIMARHRLLKAVKALIDKGITPPGVAIEHQKVRSAAIVLPPDQPFKDGARDAMIARPSVAPATV